MRLIDADELKKQAYKSGDWNKPLVVDVADIDDAPTVDQWHYPSRGEYPPKLEENHPMSYKCIVAIKGIISGKTYIDIARYDFSGKAWFSYPEGRVNVYAWKVEEPPKENA